MKHVPLFVMILLGLSPGPSASGESGITVVGITSPIKDATLSASVPGTINLIHVKEGDQVEKDKVILELKKMQEELEVARRKLIMESTVEVEAAADRVATVKIDLEGTRKLFTSTGSVSEEEVAQKELEYKLAVAELGRLKLVEQREKLEYQIALEQLGRREIRAPMTGTITRLHLEEGENCDLNQPLVRIVDASRFYFVGNVDATTAEKLATGTAVRLTLIIQGSSIEKTGTISFISPVVDPASGLQEIKAEFDNPDGAVRPGVSGVLHIP